MSDTVGRDDAIILLVEDDEDTRTTLATALRVAGFRAHSVSTYPEARRVMDAVRVAVVILDIGRGTADLADALSIRTRRPAPRVIAFADRAPEPGRRYTLFDLYLVKPCPPEHLVLAVEGVLTRPREHRP